jgi:hypothetical protein
MVEYVALPNSWSTYVVQISQMLDGLGSVQKWDSLDQLTLENIVKLCKYNIEGTSYRDPYENNLPKLWFLSKEYQSIVRSRLDLAASKLRELDPSYTAPTVEVKKKIPVSS